MENNLTVAGINCRELLGEYHFLVSPFHKSRILNETKRANDCSVAHGIASEPGLENVRQRRCQEIFKGNFSQEISTGSQEIFSNRTFNPHRFL